MASSLENVRINFVYFYAFFRSTHCVSKRFAWYVVRIFAKY